MNRHCREEVKVADGKLCGKLLLRALGKWDDRANSDFQKLPLDTIDAEITMYKSLCDEGKMKLEGIFEEDTGKRVGTLVCAAVEGVFLISAAAMDSGAGYENLLEAGEQRARELGCRILRVDTTRPGILKKLLDFGYVPGHIALSKQL